MCIFIDFFKEQENEVRSQKYTFSFLNWNLDKIRKLTVKIWKLCYCFINLSFQWLPYAWRISVKA